MSFLRKVSLGVLCGLSPVLLFSFGLGFSLERVLGTSDSLKNALRESGLYDAAAGNFIALAQERQAKSGIEQGGAQANELPLDRPEVRAIIIERSFPGESLQPQTEKAIDNAYAWLRGEAAQLKFSFDLHRNQDILLANLSQYVRDRAAALPVCLPGAPLTAEFDPFTSTCRPTELSPDVIAQQAQNSIKQSGFFERTPVSTDGSNDQPNPQISRLPNIYDMVTKGIYIAGGLALLFLIAVMLLSQPRREGIQRAAKIMLGVGGSSIILALLSIFLTGKLADLLARSGGETPSFQASLTNLVHILASDVRTWWLAYGILLLVMSVSLYLVLRLLAEKEIIERNNAIPPQDRPQVVVN